jgi:hypothetical protein
MYRSLIPQVSALLSERRRARRAATIAGVQADTIGPSSAPASADELARVRRQQKQRRLDSLIGVGDLTSATTILGRML